MNVLHTITRTILMSLLFWMTVGLAQADVLSTTFYHNDALGSPIAATDENGDIKWREHYRPYGEKIIYDAESLDNSRWYTSHPHDEETGLTYAGARYYDPVVGRFMAIDPVGVAGSIESNIHMFNRYAYANNNPYKFVDPDGRNPTQFSMHTNDIRIRRIADSNPHFHAQAQAWQATGVAVTSLAILAVMSPVTAAAITLSERTGILDVPVASKGGSNLPVKFDGEFATKQVLGTTKTPGGRDINFHAADRMVNPPKGRSLMSPSEVDQVLDGATNIRKRSFHPQGNTLTIQNRNMPGKPQVIVDEATGNRVITVINPKRGR